MDLMAIRRGIIASQRTLGVISFLPIQTGTGNPTPTNVRPITAPLDITGIGKIYAGEYNADTGVLTSTWIKRDMSEMSVATPTSSSEPWMYIFSLRPVWVTNVGYEKAGGENNILCEVAKVRNGSEPFANYIISGASNSAVMYSYDNIIDSTAEAWKAKYTGYNIAYELLPSLYQTYNLTPSQQAEALAQLRNYNA